MMFRIPRPGREGEPRYMSLVEHPLALRLKPWLRYRSRGTARRTSWRVEVSKGMPDALLEQAQQIEICCQHTGCTNRYQPFRQRMRTRRDGERVYANAWYVVGSCSPDVSRGCSKGDAASSEMEKIVAWLQDN